MPLPRVVARVNKRYTNWLIEPIVRRTPGFAVVEHVGRRTGSTYRTPVYTFDAGSSQSCGHLFVALTYGPSADWAQNVIAGNGTIRRNNTRQAIVTAIVVDRADAWHYLPRFVRVVLRILRVHNFLRLTTT